MQIKFRIRFLVKSVIKTERIVKSTATAASYTNAKKHVGFELLLYLDASNFFKLEVWSVCDCYAKPEIVPSASTSISTAIGRRGNPGIVNISPVNGTTNPAPAATRTSRTVIRKP